MVKLSVELGKLTTVIEPIFGTDQGKDFIQSVKFNQPDELTSEKPYFSSRLFTSTMFSLVQIVLIVFISTTLN